MSQGTVNNQVFYYTKPLNLELASEECPLPGPGEIRCKTLCSLVSIGTEMTCFDRNVEPGSIWDEWIQFPFQPGYSSVGQVTEIGEGVSGIALGDRVCSTSPHRAWFLDRPETVIPVPEGITAEQASWFFLNIIVQNGVRESRPVMGENAVVIGLGPLGQLAARYLGLAGLNHLLAVDPVARRCELAQGHGPTEILCCAADKAESRVSDLTGGQGADLVVDITGHPSVFHTSHRMLGKRGRLGLIGDVAFPSRQTLTHDVISKSISIVGAHGSIPPWRGNPYYRWGKCEMTGFFFNLIQSGRFKVDNLITHRIKPDEAPEVYKEIHSDRSSYLGVVIDWR